MAQEIDFNLNKNGPFKATALWNQCIGIFRHGIYLTDHRHLFHKHKQCFTGKEATSFMTNVLSGKNIFNRAVTREQAAQLLQQFLQTGIIKSVDKCPYYSSTHRFMDSSKYLYELSDKVDEYQSVNEANHKSDLKRSVSTPAILSSNTMTTRGTCEIPRLDLMKAVVTKLSELVYPQEIVQYIPFESMNSQWIAENIKNSKDYNGSTVFPDWVWGAVVHITEGKQPGNLVGYPQFKVDVLKVVIDYYVSVGSPLISPQFAKLFIKVYKIFDKVNQQNKPVKPVRVEKQIEKPYCYETAFTSEYPTTKVIPKSCENLQLLKSNYSTLPRAKPPLIIDTENLRPRNPKTVYPKSPTPLKCLTNTYQYMTIKPKATGIVNQAFNEYSPRPETEPSPDLYYEPEVKSILKPTQSYPQLPHEVVRPRSTPTSIYNLSSFKDGGFVNEALSPGYPSSDDEDDQPKNNFDYNLALQNICQLVKASQRPGNYQHIDENLLPLKHIQTKKENLMTKWSEEVESKAIHCFQLLLTLLPPTNRIQIYYLLKIYRNVPFVISAPHNNQMLTTLKRCLMRSVNDHDRLNTDKLTMFLVSKQQLLLRNISVQQLNLTT